MDQRGLKRTVDRIREDQIGLDMSIGYVDWILVFFPVCIFLLDWLRLDLDWIVRLEYSIRLFDQIVRLDWITVDQIDGPIDRAGQLSSLQ